MWSLGLLRACSLLLAHAALPAAQDAPPLEARSRAEELVVVRTANERLASALMRGEPLPERAEGGHWVLAMGSDRKWSCVAAPGEVHAAEINARVRALMGVFEEEVDRVRPMAKTAATLAAGRLPLKPKQLAQLMDDILDFPRQVDALTLVVREEDDGDYHAHTELQPAAQSALARFVAALAPSGRGVPELAGDGAMTVATDVDVRALKPFLGWAGELMVGNLAAEEREAMRKFVDATWDTYDGTMRMDMGVGAMRFVMGVSDSAKLAELMAADDWMRLTQSFTASMPDVETEIQRVKLGELDAWRSVTTLGDNPLFPDGKIVTLSAQAGDIMMWCANQTQAQFVAQIERARSGKWRRAPLPGGALMECRMELAELARFAPQEHSLPPDMPQAMSLHVGKKGTALTLDVRFEQ